MTGQQPGEGWANPGRAAGAVVGGWARVSGGAAYVADIRAPDALHVAFVHAQVPHARLDKIDTGSARVAPGVVDVVTAEDVGRFLLGRAVRDYPVLADGRVLFVGQRIAAVAAVDRESARAAAALVEVEYAELPPVLGLDAAMALDDDHLHPGYADYDGAVAGRPGPNSQGISATRSGAVDTAFAQAARVFDDTFTCGRSHPAPLEPHACLVSVGAGRVDIWSTHKEPHTLRRNVAEFCGRDLSEVRVHLAPIGGDFGSKGFPFVELVCVAIAARTGRPVRHTMSYDEELTTTAARHPLRMRLRTAVDQDARLCAVDVETALDGGAFAALKAVPTAVLPLIGAPFGSLPGRVPT